MQRLLLAFDGITRVDVSPVTDRITVCYDREMLSVDHVLHLLRSTGFASAKGTSARPRADDAADAGLRRMPAS